MDPDPTNPFVWQHCERCGARFYGWPQAHCYAHQTRRGRLKVAKVPTEAQERQERLTRTQRTQAARYRLGPDCEYVRV